MYKREYLLENRRMKISVIIEYKQKKWVNNENKNQKTKKE